MPRRCRNFVNAWHPGVPASLGPPTPPWRKCTTARKGREPSIWRFVVRGRGDTHTAQCARSVTRQEHRMLSPADSDAVLEAESRTWWVYLITGALWIIFGFIVLSARSEITTIWAVTIYAGILFFLVGVGELVTAMAVTEWRWLHIVFGIAAIGAGHHRVRLARPDVRHARGHPGVVPADRRALRDRRRVLRPRGTRVVVDVPHHGRGRGADRLLGDRLHRPFHRAADHLGRRDRARQRLHPHRARLRAPRPEERLRHGRICPS